MATNLAFLWCKYLGLLDTNNNEIIFQHGPISELLVALKAQFASSVRGNYDSARNGLQEICAAHLNCEWTIMTIVALLFKSIYLTRPSLDVCFIFDAVDIFTFNPPFSTNTLQCTLKPFCKMKRNMNRKALAGLLQARLHLEMLLSHSPIPVKLKINKHHHRLQRYRDVY